MNDIKYNLSPDDDDETPIDEGTGFTDDDWEDDSTEELDDDDDVSLDDLDEGSEDEEAKDGPIDALDPDDRQNLWDDTE